MQASPSRQRRSRRPAKSNVLTRLLRHRSGAIGLFLSTFFVLLALFGGLFAPYPPAQADYSAINQGISAAHWLGTDNFGRDLLSRILVGARYSIGIGVAASLLGAFVGSLWGLWAGFVSGFWDALSMRLVDVLLAFPGLLLAIGFIAISGPGLVPLILAASLFGLPIFARLARAATLSIKSRTHIEAARTLGARPSRIVFQHILPNMLAPVLVYVSLRTGVTLLVASGLSFLGLGIQPPTPEWGAMLSESQLYLPIHPLMAFVPGTAITLAVLGFNLLGDGLRDVLDPTLSTER
jgi:ABC-type dipeptide/oligopeptide/nickel transport system permease subunit